MNASAPKLALSTSSVYPESTAAGFALARQLGFDGIELMVGADPTSADVDAVQRLAEYHEVPVVSVHAPTLAACLDLAMTRYVRVRAAPSP